WMRGHQGVYARLRRAMPAHDKGSSLRNSLRLDDDVVVLDADRKRLGDVGAFDQFGARLHLDRILPHADPARIAPRFAGADVELPAVPGALHHLASPRIAVVAGLLRLHEPSLNAKRETAAAVRAAVVEREIVTAEVEHDDGASVHLDELAPARRNLIDRRDDVARHQPSR